MDGVLDSRPVQWLLCKLTFQVLHVNMYMMVVVTGSVCSRKAQHVL